MHALVVGQIRTRPTAVEVFVLTASNDVQTALHSLHSALGLCRNQGLDNSSITRLGELKYYSIEHGTHPKESRNRKC